MTVLFWDIDGTLLTTARGGMFAWDDGVKEITGKDFQLQQLRVPGLTDYQIAAKTCELLDLEPTAQLVERLVRRYEELLPTSLGKDSVAAVGGAKAAKRRSPCESAGAGFGARRGARGSARL